jgi:ferric-dicitrate binding protein FerR (iron transport regulator)
MFLKCVKLENLYRMIQDIPWYLLERHFAHETNGFEEEQVNEWIRAASENSMIYDQLKDHYQHTGSLPVEFKPDVKAAFHKIDLKLRLKTGKTFGISRVWIGAAASILILVVGYMLFKSNINQQPNKPFLTVRTTDSTTFLKLADGSRVWLNAGSTLEYPENFETTREVRLSGEGYFEIVHNPSHPFVVHTKHNVIKDIGTKFDIRSYNEEAKNSVMVTEGSVSFANQHNKQMILKLNQMCSYHKEKDEFGPVSTLNPNDLAWKTREFIFDNASLCNVFQALSSIYHFEYKFLDSETEKRKITTQFKELSLQDIASVISLATKTEIKITKDKNEKLYITIN